ncbi:MAG: hypothetical protein Crog4KO_33340 [Crocinitomicaceae bacterium]
MKSVNKKSRPIRQVRFSEVISSMPKYNWIKTLDSDEFKNVKIPITKAELNHLADSFYNQLSKGKIGKAKDFFSLGCFVDKARFLNRIKRRGGFRVYNYLNNKNHAEELAKFALDNSTLFEWDENEIKFFNSVILFSKLHSDLSKMKSNILVVMNKNKTFFAKSILSYADETFDIIRRKEEKTIYGEERNDKFELEDIAEGISYLLSIYDDIHGISDENILHSSSDFTQSAILENVILDAATIKLFAEQEVFVESLGFYCLFENGKVTIYPPSIEWGKSYHYGLMEINLSNHGFAEGFRGFLSMNEQVEKFNKDTDGVICQVDEGFIENKSLMAIPHELLDELVSILLSKNSSVYFEEAVMLRGIEQDLMLNFDQLEKFEIRRGFTFKDLFLVKRLFNFLSTAYFKELRKKSKTNYFNSNTPFLARETIQLLLSKIITPEKVELFIDTFAYHPSRHKICDIQYTPIIQGEVHNLFLLNVFGKSNVFRNVLFSLNKRIYSDLKIDPIADKLESSLINLGFRTKQGVKISYHGEKTDIDVLAWKGKNIFIFECKNSILPVGAREIRSVMEQINKAVNIQLPLAEKALSDRAFANTVLGKSTSDFKIHGCVVTSNKLFSGLFFNGYSIHNLSRLSHFINVGQKLVIDGDNRKKISLWKNEKFQTEDLVQYLSETNQYYSPIFDAQIEDRIEYKVGKTGLATVVYPLNSLKMAENFENLNYREIPKDNHL